MKKVLFLLTMAFSINAISATQYIHVANLSPDEIKIKFEPGIRAGRLAQKILFLEATIKPGDVAFIQGYYLQPITPTKLIVEKILKPGFVKIDENRVFDPNKNSNIPMKTKFEFTDITNTDYYAFVVMPSPSDPDTLILKQRINSHAKMILEEHKYPANYIFFQDLPKGRAAIDLLLKR